MESLFSPNYGLAEEAVTPVGVKRTRLVCLADGCPFQGIRTSCWTIGSTCIPGKLPFSSAHTRNVDLRIHYRRGCASTWLKPMGAGTSTGSAACHHWHRWYGTISMWIRVPVRPSLLDLSYPPTHWLTVRKILWSDWWGSQQTLNPQRRSTL